MKESDIANVVAVYCVLKLSLVVGKFSSSHRQYFSVGGRLCKGTEEDYFDEFELWYGHPADVIASAIEENKFFGKDAELCEQGAIFSPSNTKINSLIFENGLLYLHGDYFRLKPVEKNQFSLSFKTANRKEYLNRILTPEGFKKAVIAAGYPDIKYWNSITLDESIEKLFSNAKYESFQAYKK